MSRAGRFARMKSLKSTWCGQMKKEQEKEEEVECEEEEED